MAGDEWLSDVMGGVQLRLSDPVGKVRRMGMRVAEALSHLIDPANPLRFDDADGSLTQAETDPVRVVLRVAWLPSSFSSL